MDQLRAKASLRHIHLAFLPRFIVNASFFAIDDDRAALTYNDERFPQSFLAEKKNLRRI
jgi:hypothetical protein